MALQHDDKLKNRTKNYELFIGAIINFIIGIGHVVCMSCLNRVFEIYGIADIMNRFAETYGNNIPYMLTLIIAFCFFVCGIYGLSGCGIIPKLPLLKPVTFVIATVFLLRTVWGISIMIKDFSCLELSSASVSACVGFLYLFGGIKLFLKNIHTKNNPIYERRRSWSSKKLFH
jgi:hypothetical protein